MARRRPDDGKEKASRCHRLPLQRHQPPAARLQVILLLLLRRLRFALPAHRRLLQADRHECDAGRPAARLPAVRGVRQRSVLGHHRREVAPCQGGDAGVSLLLGGLHASPRLRTADPQLVHQPQHDTHTPVAALARPAEALVGVEHSGRSRQNQEMGSTGTGSRAENGIGIVTWSVRQSGTK